MAAVDRRGRLALSCDSCRTRKTRCIRLRNGSCQKCSTAGRECITSHAKSSRPYYQTSKEQFELMSTIVHHFLPNVTTDIEELREVASSLSSRKAHRPREPYSTPELAITQTTSAVALELSNDDSISIDPMSEDNGISNTLDILAQYSDEHQSGRTPSLEEPLCGPGQNAYILSPPRTMSPEPFTSQEKLLPDAMNSRRFDNGSGWGSFFRTIRPRLPPNKALLPSSSPADFADGKPIVVAFPKELPPQGQMDEATAKFFAEVNSTINILNFEKFQDTVGELYDLKRASSNASIAIVLGVVALAGDSDYVLYQACQYLDPTVAEGSLESVQAIMILAICRLNREERNAGWVLLGCALRIARSLGLDQDPELWPRERRYIVETKRRLWWSLCSLDTDLACSIGRPPDRNRAECKDAANRLKMDEMCINPYTPPGYSMSAATLTIIVDSILLRLYSQASIPRSVDSTVRQMLTELNNWINDLPPHLEPSSPIAPTHLRAVSYLHMRYYQCVVLLTRPYLLKSDDRSCGFTVECETANQRSLTILKTLHNHGLLSKINHLDGMYVLSSGMILLLRAIRWPTALMLAELEEYAPVLQTMRQLRIGRFAMDYMTSYIENLRTILGNQSSLIAPRAESDADQESFDLINFDQRLEDFLNSAASTTFDYSTFME